MSGTPSGLSARSGATDELSPLSVQLGSVGRRLVDAVGDVRSNLLTDLRSRGCSISIVGFALQGGQLAWMITIQTDTKTLSWDCAGTHTLHMICDGCGMEQCMRTLVCCR